MNDKKKNDKDLNKRLSIAMAIFALVMIVLLIIFLFICYKVFTVDDINSARKLLLTSCIFALVTLSTRKWLTPLCMKIAGLDKMDLESLEKDNDDLDP